MGKFSFPGRKKQPPQVMVTAPVMSKAQKILGSTALNIDDEFSTSKTSLNGTERSATASYVSSSRGPAQRNQREWGDESDVVPRQFRTNARPATAHEEDYDSFDEYGDLISDMTSALRKRQSSSTLSSWYDKSKQPLSISQQTSSSAMAKGLPTKAQKMLDMDSTLADLKSRKKPAKLDLSHIMSRRTKKREQPRPTWEGPILGADQLVTSPTILSPTSSPSIRGRLTKRPTKESLRSIKSESIKTAGTDASSRAQNHLDGLPNLYEHYEQMSFRQVVDRNLEAPDMEEQEKPRQQLESQPQPHSRRIIHNAKSTQSLNLPPHHDEQIISQYAKRTLPQTPHASLLAKAEASSPTDCAASVSSRHTRTSKASKRTDRSFQESDLLEKSVLSLSSDSEDDVYLESSFKSSSSVPDYPASDSGSYLEQRSQTSRHSQSVESKRFSKSSKSSKRTSLAPSTKSGNYLTIPNGNVKLPTVSARSSSHSGSSANTIQEGTIARSPSQMSSISNASSVNTTMTWQSKAGLGLHQARAITMQTAQGPSESEVESDSDPDNQRQETDVDNELDASNMQTYVSRDSTLNAADQPTPPLSPSSVDFYIRSAHSSVDGQSSHNRFMAVTRQEEMLLAALRHKRQIMRETIISEMEDGARAEKSSNHIPVPRGHISKPSEATITESSFDLDFPAPPTMCKDKTTVTADGTTIIDLRHGTSQSHLQVPSRASGPIPKASPALPSTKKALMKAQKEFNNEGQERILLYLDHPHDHANGPIEEAEPSPDLSDFMEFEAEEPESSGEAVSQVLLYPSQTRRTFADRSASTRRPEPVKSHKNQPTERSDELDIPRPDSPISPNLMSTMPRRAGTVNKKTARLSAVGPARWGYED